LIRLACVELSDITSQANTIEIVNSPVLVDDMMYSPYDQRSVGDMDDFKPPYNVRIYMYSAHLLTAYWWSAWAKLASAA